MKTIFFTISRGSLIRNFLHTGVVSRLLENGNKVVVLTPAYDDKDLFEEYKDENLVFEPLIMPKKVRLKRLIAEMSKGAIFNKTIHIRYKYRFAGAKPRMILYIPRILLLAPLRLIPGIKSLIWFLDARLNPQTEHDYLFQKYKPDLVFVTTTTTDSDVGVLKSAIRFKTKTVCIPKSWDNLSRLLFRIKADYMIVWSQFMKEQAIRYQGYEPRQIIVTGVPQFDQYASKKGLLSREEFCQKHGFDPENKIILYGSTGGHCFSEADYLELIQKFREKGHLKNAQVLIRPHLGYVGDVDKFEKLEKHKGFAIDRTDKQSDKFKDHWDTSKSHLSNLFNSLYHADICINIASTLTLDSLFCNTEVININFDVRKDIDFNQSVKRFYKADYIEAVTSFGATWLVESEDDFFEALVSIVEKDMKKDEETKKKMIDHFTYKNDGESARRVADSLIRIINN